MSFARLKRIDQLVDRYIGENQLVGALTLVARNGKLIHFHAQGHADVEANRPLKKNDIFRIYSMTKPICSVAAMMLFEEGKFQLGDPIHRYLPELGDVKVYVENGEPGGGRVAPNRPMTVRDLLTHTSGLTYGVFGEDAVDKLYNQAGIWSADTTERLVTRLGQLPLKFHPGAQWQYSRSTDVLGRLIEVTSGLTLDDFFEQRIFEPLKMQDTAFHVPAAKLDRLTVNYQWSADGERTVADHPSNSKYKNKPTFLSGGAGLVSTAEDYLRFCQMMLNEGELDGVRLLGAKTVRLMTKNHLDDAVSPSDGFSLGPGAGFGLGFRVVLDDARHQRLASAGTYGWGGMASTMFFIDPREQLIGIILPQKFPTDLYLRDLFQTAVYQSIVESHDDQ